jgi:hypothetical protein
MTVQLLDGPCKGDYLVKRSPVFLRAVRKETGETDLLDQVNDLPAKNEKVFVYQIEGEAGWVHIKMVRRSESGFYALATYRYLPDVDGEKLRDNTIWQDWAIARLKEKNETEVPQKQATTQDHGEGRPADEATL